MINKEEKKWVEKAHSQGTSKKEMVTQLETQKVSPQKIEDCSSYFDGLNKKNKGLFDKMFNREKMKKGNKVAVVLLRDNGLADFKEVEAINEQFSIEGKGYHVERDCIYTTQKDRIPLAIIREWDLIPLGTKKWYETEGQDERMREKFAQLERHVLRGIKNFELWKVQDGKQGQNLDMKKVILYVLVAFIIGAVVINYI